MYLVSYDIESDRIRNKIAKTLEGYGRRVQYSVFECDLTHKRYQELYRELSAITKEMKDGDICFYYICKNCEAKKTVLGVPKSTDGYPREDVIVI